jgi:hypothetical protein
MRKTQIPIPVTLNDCVLLNQMGYAVQVNDGRVLTIEKEGKKRGKNIT